MPAPLALHIRSVLAGYGWAFVAKDGTVHVRSLVDRALERPHQPDFAAPHLKDNIESRREFIVLGEGMLAAGRIPPLTNDELERYNILCLEFADELHDDAKAAKEKSVARQVGLGAAFPECLCHDRKGEG